MFRRYQNPPLQGTLITPNVMQAAPVVRLEGIYRGTPEFQFLADRFGPAIEHFIRAQRHNQQISGLDVHRRTVDGQYISMTYARLHGVETITIRPRPEFFVALREEQASKLLYDDDQVWTIVCSLSAESCYSTITEMSITVTVGGVSESAYLNLLEYSEEGYFAGTVNVVIYVGDNAGRYGFGDVNDLGPEYTKMSPALELKEFPDGTAGDPINGFISGPGPYVDTYIENGETVAHVTGSQVAEIIPSVGETVTIDVDTSVTVDWGNAPTQYLEIAVSGFRTDARVLTLPTPRNFERVLPGVSFPRYVTTAYGGGTTYEEVSMPHSLSAVVMHSPGGPKIVDLLSDTLTVSFGPLT